MDPLQKLKHIASPSLAQCYQEYKNNPPCMKVDRQNHAECCGCKEPCCTIQIPAIPKDQKERE